MQQEIFTHEHFENKETKEVRKVQRPVQETELPAIQGSSVVEDTVCAKRVDLIPGLAIGKQFVAGYKYLGAFNDL